MSVILGIDPSLSNTGLCWGSGPDEHKSDTYTFKMPKGSDTKLVGNRMLRISRLTGCLEAALEKITVENLLSDLNVFVETYSFGSRNGGEYLGEYGWALRDTIYDHTENLIEVAPTAVKKFATGKGNSKKEVIIGHVQKRWNVLFDNSDEADAYVLYRIGLCYAGICEPETQAQREVIKKLKGE